MNLKNEIQGTAKTKSRHLERPIRIKEEITIEEIKLEPDNESLNPHPQWTTEESHFEQASTIRNVQSKTRANVRKPGNQGFDRGNGVKKRFYQEAIADPKYQKPFLYGWRREVVYSRRGADKATIFYWKGWRVFRNCTAIWRYLVDTGETNLTKDNFLFYQIPLGLDKSREIVRFARPTKDDENLPKIRSLREIYKEKIIDKHKKVEDVPKNLSNDNAKEKPNKTDRKRSFKAAFDPQLYEPFDHGWKREVIYKNKKTDMAIYYISPSNKIIQSIEGISSYLKTLPNNQLTTSNFTFHGAPLGINDSTKEIIRRLTTELPERDHTSPCSSPPPKRKNIEDIKDPKFRKPFSYGWTRELVYRAVRSQQHKFIDIYYYPKEGCKLRSKVEVEEYLKKIRCKTLTADNFTFLQDAIGPPDPTKEIIRTAVKQKKKRKH